MSDAVAEKLAAQSQPPMPFEADHYVTLVGGLASCPTGGSYWIPFHAQTPAEVVGTGMERFPVPTGAWMETRPSFDLHALIGSAIAETTVLVGGGVVGYRCLGCEEFEAARRTTLAPYLAKAAEAWEDTLRFVERLDEAPSHEDPGPRAWEAFKEVAALLEATDQEVAEAIGIGRTTVYTWQREDREPRRGTARRVYELRTALRSLRRRLGDEGLRRWLLQGAPTRREVIVAGDLGSVAADIDSVLFADASRPDLAAAPPDTGGVEPLPGAERPRPRRRRVKRVKLR